MSQPETCTFREFAELIRCRPSYVTELRKAGRLALTEDGKRVRVAESIALIEATRDPARAGVAARHAEQRGAVLASAPIDADDDTAEVFSDPATTSDARRRAKALADKAEADAASAIRENLIADGKLYEAAEVDSALESCVTTLRKALERLPATVAPQIAGVVDEARVRDILTAEIEQMQRELERGFLAIGKSGE